MPALDLALTLNVMAAVLISGSVLTGLGFLVRELSMAQRRNARLHGENAAAARPKLLDMAAHQVAEGAGRLGSTVAGGRDPAELSILRQRLIQAGFNQRGAVGIFLGARFAALAVAVTTAVILVPWMLLAGGKTLVAIAVAVLALGAVLGPDQVLKSLRRQREIEYREGFPDVLDLLVASVEAGLSLDAAVSRVAEEMNRRHPRLGEHLRLLTLELRAGRARKDAWSSLADRLGIDEARSFATMLRQAETMGTSLGETLAVFAADMRTRRMLRAEEKAMALPAKLVVPMILFIFPCLLTVLILPAAYRVSQTLGGM